MNFFGDYHTHTIYSKKSYILHYHAKGTIEDNVISAKQKNLKEIAITDHGFNHVFYGCSRKNLKSTKEEVERISQKYNIKVYFGVEANFISTDGTIDVTDSDRKYLDIVLCGYHKSAKTKTLRDKFQVFWKNLFAKYFGTSKKLFEQNTQMVLNAIEKNRIDVITHLNSKMKCDVVKIAKKAAEKGTFIELNEKHCDFTKNEIKDMIEKTEVKFIVDSDAHKPHSIGFFPKVKNFILENNIPKERIVNLEKLPQFLSLKKQ